jgi:long-chain acyl-CoA synthetase
LDAEILTRRAEMARAIEGQTICGLLELAAREFAGRPALSEPAQGRDRDEHSERAAPGAVPPEDDGWHTLTWPQARDRVLRLAASFEALGLAPGERVALMLPNRTEHWLADQAAVHAAGVPVTLYATLAPEQIAYTASDCDARIAVLDGERELALWRPALATLPGLKKIIVRDPAACPAGEPYLSWDEFADLGERRLAADPEAVARRVASLRPDDTVTVLYTSGTTGKPKGVRITHRNVLYETAAAAETVGGTVEPGGILRPPPDPAAGPGEEPEPTRWVSYLPLAHIAERMYSIYLAIAYGGHVYFCHDAAALAAATSEVRPTGFFGVPRVWEKIQAAIKAGLAAQQDPARHAAVERAMDVGRRYIEGTQMGRAVPAELAEAFQRADAQVLQPIRALAGLGAVANGTSAAAPLPADVTTFFASLGLPILDVYGMTETTGAFTSNTPACFKLGTVGRPLPGVEVRIAGDGEVLARGPLTTPGYLNLPDATAELIDADGWLHTGDIGALDDDGFLSITGRKKEMIITAGGENIAPAAVEGLLTESALIGQALCYGDGRPYVVALLTMDSDAARAWAGAHGLGDAPLAELAAHPDVLAAVGGAVAAANARLSRVQQIKRWRLLPQEWTSATGEVTPTLKLRRRVIHTSYADLIDELYRT